MKAVLFVSSENSHGKKDATGAFIPEARKFKNRYDGDCRIAMIDCTKSNPPTKRRSAVYAELSKHNDLVAVGFYGHGWSNGIQFGFKKSHCVDLARAIYYASHDDVKIGLFACLTAENSVRDNCHGDVGPGTDGGFADTLRDEMVRIGVSTGWVDAHKTAGHTTWNPYVVRFRCENVDDSEYGGIGGSWLIAPRSKHWKKWCRNLRANIYGIRTNFLFLDEDQIIEELNK